MACSNMILKPDISIWAQVVERPAEPGVKIVICTFLTK